MAIQNEDYEIVGSYNNQRYTNIDAERSVNMFEYIDPKGKKPSSLINTSGLVNSGFDFSLSNGEIRAQFVFNNIMYVVVSNLVFSIQSNGVVTLLNNLSHLTTTSGYVAIDANTFQIIFVDGMNGYIWDTTASTFKQITDQAFPATPIDVCFLDGFFIVANGNTNSFQLSSLNQGMVWGPASNAFTTNNGGLPNQLIIGASNLSGGLSGTANYATGIPLTLTVGMGGSLAGTGLAVSTTYYSILVDATHIKLATSYTNAIAGVPVTLTGDVTPVVNVVSNGQLQLGSLTSHPGTIVACKTLHRRLFLFSQFFTEVWENAGVGTNLPFRRNNSLLIEYGTPATASVSVGFDRMFFLSQDRDGLGAVMDVNGTQAIPVSTQALDFQLAQYASLNQISDCRSFLIKERGIIFYRMNFTAANHTFVLNVTQSSMQNLLWHEEEVLNRNRHPAQTHAYFNGTNYVGHYNLPIIYEIDSDIYDNDGESIRRMRIGKAIVPKNYQRLRIDRFQLDLIQGNLLEGEIIEPLNLDTESGLDLLTENGFTLEINTTELVIRPINPIVFLAISRDGGQTYGYEIQSFMGKAGNRTARTVWRKLGTVPRGQAFVPRFQFFDPVPFVILGASWVFEIMPE